MASRKPDSCSMEAKADDVLGQYYIIIAVATPRALV